jgi:hypothetical protein
MQRKLVWDRSQKLDGFGCSECGWKFGLTSLPVGDTSEELKEQYEAQRDTEFAAHVCASRPTSQGYGI